MKEVTSINFRGVNYARRTEFGSSKLDKMKRKKEMEETQRSCRIVVSTPYLEINRKILHRLLGIKQMKDYFQ